MLLAMLVQIWVLYIIFRTFLYLRSIAEPKVKNHSVLRLRSDTATAIAANGEGEIQNCWLNKRN